MRTWKELGTAFRSLEGGRTEARLDYQWGAAGEHWRVCGLSSSSYVQQFDALAQIAGVKLLESGSSVSDPDILDETNDRIRWYRALVRLSGRFEHRFVATQVDDQGRPAGNLYSGFVAALSDVAANMCLILEAQSASSASRLDVALAGARYAGPMMHWVEAKRLLADEERDAAGAVHEAVSAVEGMARLILGDPTITLGQALHTVRQAGVLHPALAKCIEGVWGYSSSVPGIRHGAAPPVAVLNREAKFAVETCEAALQMLIEIDGTWQSTGRGTAV